jgi:hypothetical protein
LMPVLVSTRPQSWPFWRMTWAMAWWLVLRPVLSSTVVPWSRRRMELSEKVTVARALGSAFDVRMRSQGLRA